MYLEGRYNGVLEHSFGFDAGVPDQGTLSTDLSSMTIQSSHHSSSNALPFMCRCVPFAKRNIDTLRA